MSKRSLCFLLICLPLFAGCNRYYYPSLLAPSAVLERINKPKPDIQSLQGIVKVQLQSTAGNYLLAQKLYYLAPSHLRLEIAGIFGLPAVLVFIDGDDFQMFIPVRNILIKGKTGELGPAFSINDLIFGFFYGAKLDFEPGQKIEVEENDRSYRLIWISENQQQIAWIDKRTGLLSRQETRSLKDGRKMRVIQRTGVIKAGGSFYPTSVSLYDRSLQQKVTFRFSSLTFNPVLSQDLFKVKLPAQYEERKLTDFFK